VPRAASADWLDNTSHRQRPFTAVWCRRLPRHVQERKIPDNDDDDDDDSDDKDNNNNNHDDNSDNDRENVRDNFDDDDRDRGSAAFLRRERLSMCSPCAVVDLVSSSLSQSESETLSSRHEQWFSHFTSRCTAQLQHKPILERGGAHHIDDRSDRVSRAINNKYFIDFNRVLVASV